MDYRIGLDIGITSVGWAVLENNSQDEPKRIVDLGVRIFDAAEVPKTGEALAAKRRAARTTRRRLRRRRHRLERIRYLLQKEGLIDIEKFNERYHKGNLPNVYELRLKGLDSLLSDDEFAQILIHIAKHRGFKSTRKSEAQDTEGGKVLKETSENQKIMLEKGYRTVGEMICKDEKFITDCPWSVVHYEITPRNKQDDYRHTILRDMLVEEVHILFARQREMGNVHLSEALEEKYIEIMCNQRSFDKGPGLQADGTPSPYAGDLIEKMVGKCTFEREEKRASKACYTSERFVLLQKLNNLKIVDKNRNQRFLSLEERDLIVAMAYHQKDVKYAAIRKKLGLAEEDKFNSLVYSKGKEVAEIEKASFVKLTYFHDVKKALGEDYSGEKLESEKVEQLDKIATILTYYKEDATRKEKFAELGLTEEQMERLLSLNSTKFQHLSLKVMKKILPFLENGMLYHEACEEAGYNFKADFAGEKKKFLKGEEINEIINEIPNPVVKRSISQTVKVINAIIQKYGSPQAIGIELAREMSKNHTERMQLNKSMKENQEKNDRIKKALIELGRAYPTGQDIVRYKLWKEQGEVCMYSGKRISIEDLFERGKVDIDHIIPYSISFDDSYRNKVLVLAEENRQKGNRTPYQYFGDCENRWHKYELLVESSIHDYRKRQILLKKEMTEDEIKGFKERNIQDTKYITTVVYNMLRNHLEFAPYTNPEKKKRVYAVNGAVTAYLRKRWGLMQNEQGERIEKDRSIDTHHAKDAVVVACCTDGMIQKISQSVKARELARAYGVSMIDYETGEIIDRNQYTNDEWDEKYGKRIPLPWPHFKTELDIRFGDDPVKFLREHPHELNLLDYPEDWLDPQNRVVRPIFVSRMPNHKVTGQGHEETIRSPRHFEEEGFVIFKKDIKGLRLDKNGEIADYYNPDSDRLLYEALKKQLRDYGNDGAKAFAEAFHKPKADGSVGPVVKKVKVKEKQSVGVYTNRGNGIAKNSSMVRVDVFRKNSKYYFIPVYVSDTVKKELPQKAAKALKLYDEWEVIEDEYFLFSLYQRDLFAFSHKRGMNLKRSSKGETKIYEGLAYFIGANTWTASFAGKAHDNNFEFEGMGIQSLEYLKKYQVDVLGNYYEVKQEKRRKFN